MKDNNMVKSFAWLAESTFRGYAGYMLIDHFRHNYIALAAGIYALLIAAVIVIGHFYKAHKEK